MGRGGRGWREKQNRKGVVVSERNQYLFHANYTKIGSDEQQYNNDNNKKKKIICMMFRVSVKWKTNEVCAPLPFPKIYSRDHNGQRCSGDDGITEITARRSSEPRLEEAILSP